VPVKGCPFLWKNQTKYNPTDLTHFNYKNVVQPEPYQKYGSTLRKMHHRALMPVLHISALQILPSGRYCPPEIIKEQRHQKIGLTATSQ
jgi:hypothetical protein